MRKDQLVLLTILFLSCTSFAAPEKSAKSNQWKENFEAVKKMLLTQYVDAHLSEEQLYQAATDGMLKSLNKDDHAEWNKLLDPNEIGEMRFEIKSEVVGIGVSIERFDEKTGYAFVNRVFPHSPAASSGLKVGDQIISVDGKIYKGLTLADLVYGIRGKAGDSVKIKILRGDSILSKNVTREKVSSEPLEARMGESHVGYVTLFHFSETTTETLKNALQKLKDQGMKSLVIDLSGNTGGLFDQAVDSAALFAPKGAILVRVRGREGKEEALTSKSEPLVFGIPIVVVIDEKTASGAELLAASLKENSGAKLVGSHTFGKWSSQLLEDLPNHYAVKFTSKVFMSPSGKSYSGTGIEPDLKTASGQHDAIDAATTLLTTSRQ